LLPVFSDIREQLPGCVPICGVLHAVCFPELVWQCARMLMAAEECDAIVATSRAGHRAMATALEAGAEKIARQLSCDVATVARLRIVDIPLGTDLPTEEALNREHARSLLHLPASAFCLLFIGRLTQGYKADLDVLLAAVARLAFSGRDVRLILAGQSPSAAYMAHLRAHLGALQLTNRTLILENFPDFLKSSLFAASDVFVSPVDSIQETFGIALLEAMAHARPVVATSWSGYHDLVVDGETGFLLNTKWSLDSATFVSAYATLLHPPELANYLSQRTVVDIDEFVHRLEYLASNPVAAGAMGQRARARVIENYTWPLVAKRYLEFWKDQLERARHVRTRERASLDYNSFFSHYADEALSPQDKLVMYGGRWNEQNVTDFWSFGNARQVTEIRDMIRICRMAPASVADLIDQGYSRDCILWLAKKGICRLVSASTRPEPVYQAHAATVD
jgi:glycosyltransferase involved in cell wall biosynthesis